jgi:hypothetical protein
MKVAFFAFLVFLGCVVFLVTFVADRQARLEQERFSIMKAPRSVMEADLNLQFASGSSSYMQNATPR